MNLEVIKKYKKTNRRKRGAEETILAPLTTRM